MIVLKVTRGLCVKGQRHAAGTELELPAVEAGHLLMSGRAELVEPGQRATINQALQKEATRFTSRERGGLVGAFGQSPWQSV